MQVIPVLDLLDGHAVRAVRGERSGYRPIRSSLCTTSAPVDVATALIHATGSRTLYIADLGAILERGDHAPVLAAICDALGDGVSIWLDAGYAGFMPMQALFERIASFRRSSSRSRVVPVFGTESLLDPNALEEALAANHDPILSLDYRAGRALGSTPSGSDWWPSRVIVMTLDQVGAFAGPDLTTFAAVKALAGSRELIGAGGIRHRDDLVVAEHSGAAGWLVASALHDAALLAGQHRSSEG
ncbi:HisA/HisF-related TIM barrel protein [Caballeronia sp. TF1N1]|uniref:HisA/HisF-related TIM barrel protein n=1 Tax=Caballeronia sp. TF1N1 TaxID=2878153 RepID=UPI001FD4B3B5|nr:HisA/HisF-related TIM barrel protein [Caballeronia sp. TF1N1]